MLGRIAHRDIPSSGYKVTRAVIMKYSRGERGYIIVIDGETEEGERAGRTGR